MQPASPWLDVPIADQAAYISAGSRSGAPESASDGVADIRLES